MKIELKVKSTRRVAVPPSVRTEILKTLNRRNYTAKIPAIYTERQIADFYKQCVADEMTKSLRKALR